MKYSIDGFVSVARCCCCSREHV